MHNWNILPTVLSPRALWSAKSPEREGPICTAQCDLPRINESITAFADSWNHHGLRTAHNGLPLQLYTTGYLQLRHMNVPALDFLQDVNDGYSVSEEEMAQGNPDDSEVIAPETS